MAGRISISQFTGLFFLVMLLAVVAAEAPVRRAVGKKQPRSPNPERGPIIQPPDVQDINVPVGMKLELTCLGKGEMDWQFPNANVRVGDKIRIDQLLGTSSFQSTLTISQTVVPDTGRYRCFYTNTPLSGGPDDEERDDVSLVNVFVNDLTQLFVPDPARMEGMTFRTLTENKPAIIPCRPTYSGAKVFLLNAQGRPIHKSEDIKYEPSVGFTIFYPNVFFSGDFTCRYEIEIGGTAYKQEDRLILHYVRNDDNEAPRPVIDSSRAKHVVAGSSFVLVCNVTSADDLLVDIKWEYPSPATAARAQQVSEQFYRASENGYRYRLVQTTLTVSNVDQTLDNGHFVCVSTLTSSGKKTRASVPIHVFSAGVDSHVELKPKRSRLPMMKGNLTHIDVEFRAFPAPNEKTDFDWRHNGISIRKGGRYIQLVQLHGNDKTSGVATLQIVEVSGEDAGNYTFAVKTASGKGSVNVTLIVNEFPTVELESNASRPFFDVNGTVNFDCTAIGFPRPEVVWSFQSCQKTCQESDLKPNGPWRPIPVHEVSTSVDRSDRKVHSRYPVAVRTINSGFLRCQGSNKISDRPWSAEKIQRVLASDVDGGFQVKMTPERPVEDQRVVMTCTANNYEYSEPRWEFRVRDNGEYAPVLPGNRFQLHYNKDLFSHILILVITSAGSNLSGQYRCAAGYSNSAAKRTGLIKLDLLPSRAPIFEQHVQSDPTEKELDYRSTLRLECTASGAPAPAYHWSKDGAMIDQLGTYRYENNGAILIYDKIVADDQGMYVCNASNSRGAILKQWRLKVTGSSPEEVKRRWIIAGSCVAAIVVIFIPILMYVCYRLRIEKKRREELEYLEAMLNNDTANPALIDPTVPLTEQVQLLPYDEKWEVPRENLTLFNKVLGMGQFGRVVKGQATHLFGVEGPTVVAVKMLKETADLVQRKALLGEIKIMGYIGQHLNVVNLMGAVTKNVGRGELYMLTEYCRHGSLKDYLQNHQGNRFYNQVDVITGRLLPLTDEQSETIVKQQEDLLKSAEKNWDGHIVTTRDLICYSFQITNGMNYLAGKNVIHRDLAARNVLVADDNVVKICDFGLAKQQYTYLRTNQAELPIKWLAIESIYESIFSKESDVWAFGILLWELFTLGSTPYPGVNVDSDFVERIRNGYRMERPYLAPKEIYEIMRHCWESVPKSRPDFSALAAQLGDLLENSTRKRYLDLNAPYERHNEENPSEYVNDPLKRSSQIDGSNQYLNSYRLTPAVPAPRPVTPVKPKRSIRPTNGAHNALESMELQPFLKHNRSPQNPSRPGNLIENEDYLNDNFIKVPANLSLQKNGLPVAPEDDDFHTASSLGSGGDARTNYLYAAAPKKNAGLPFSSDV